MLLLRLDEKSKRPKSRQIIDLIRQKIETRVLKPGEKLPSTRQMAGRLGLHRSTIAIAYQELWSLGFVDLKPGAKPVVRERMQMAGSSDYPAKGLVAWETVTSKAANDLWQADRHFYPDLNFKGNQSVVNFRSMNIDPRLYPVDHFRSCLNRVLRRQGRDLLGYGPRNGYPPLREYIARRLKNHGISVTPDEILLTHGSQQAIDLVIRMLAAPGRAVAVEWPTYEMLLPLVRFNGLDLIEIPIRPDGMDLALLEETLQKRQSVLVYTMPNFQNPTGVCSSQAHREQLLSLAETYRIPILEDSFEEEMKYFGRVVLPIKSMDRHHVVLYCGTFSKALFAGSRIGWIAAEQGCIERLTAIRRYNDLCSSTVLQAAMYEFCLSGYYDLQISRMHRVFRKRMQTALCALRRHIAPAWAEWSEPSGGYLIWLKLKSTAAALKWERELAAHGIQAMLGHYFFSSRSPDIYLRFSIASLDEEEIEEGFRRLARVFQKIHGSQPR